MMCEKPLGLNAGEVREMYDAARDAGVVHTTAFTYRFAPSMKYPRHLAQVRRAGRLPATSAPSGSSIGPKRAGAGVSIRDKAGAGDLST